MVSTRSMRSRPIRNCRRVTGTAVSGAAGGKRRHSLRQRNKKKRQHPKNYLTARPEASTVLEEEDPVPAPPPRRGVACGGRRYSLRQRNNKKSQHQQHPRNYPARPEASTVLEEEDPALFPPRRVVADGGRRYSPKHKNKKRQHQQDPENYPARPEASTVLEEEDPPPRRRRRRGAEAALEDLAAYIVGTKKKNPKSKRNNVVFITGAGLSVASGIRPFRSLPSKCRHKHVLQAGLWNEVIWTTATRHAFRKNPCTWYQDFWFPHFDAAAAVSGRSSKKAQHVPNAGHQVLDGLLETFSNVRQITQNIDGLQESQKKLIQVHGRVGLYKCCPDEDDDSDSDDDDDDDEEDENRPVQLGRRKTRRKMMMLQKMRQKDQQQQMMMCPYQYHESLSPSELTYDDDTEDTTISTDAAVIVPKCPSCGNDVMPQALLFDEAYHSHSYYEFERVEDWLTNMDVLVFVGTSFAVTLTQIALSRAKELQIPIFNFNIVENLKSNMYLNVSNIVGPASETLPQLLQEIQHQHEQQDQDVH